MTHSETLQVTLSLPTNDSEVPSMEYVCSGLLLIFILTILFGLPSCMLPGASLSREFNLILKELYRICLTIVILIFLSDFF